MASDEYKTKLTDLFDHLERLHKVECVLSSPGVGGSLALILPSGETGTKPSTADRVQPRTPCASSVISPATVSCAPQNSQRPRIICGPAKYSVASRAAMAHAAVEAPVRIKKTAYATGRIEPEEIGFRAILNQEVIALHRQRADFGCCRQHQLSFVVGRVVGLQNRKVGSLVIAVVGGHHILPEVRLCAASRPILQHRADRPLPFDLVGICNGVLPALNVPRLIPQLKMHIAGA